MFVCPFMKGCSVLSGLREGIANIDYGNYPKLASISNIYIYILYLCYMLYTKFLREKKSVVLCIK